MITTYGQIAIERDTKKVVLLLIVINAGLLTIEIARASE
jgi:hypothetical protein